MLVIFGFSRTAAFILVFIKSEFAAGALVLVMLVFVTAVKRDKKHKW